MTMTATLFHADPAERRDSGRRAVAQPSTLRDADERPHAVIVHDLSADGCLVSHAGALALGDRIHIGLPGVGRRSAVVVRVEEGRYGCRFEAPLAPPALADAFAGDPVVAADFSRLPVPEAPFAEPAVDKWHPAMRIALLLGASATLWTGILHLI